MPIHGQQLQAIQPQQQSNMIEAIPILNVLVTKKRPTCICNNVISIRHLFCISLLSAPERISENVSVCLWVCALIVSLVLPVPVYIAHII